MYILVKLETSTRNYIDVYISRDSKPDVNEPNTDIKVLTGNIRMVDAIKQLVFWRMYILGSA